MDATVIDTLRYANRLREAGVEAGQAEAMARAINDELSVGVATSEDVGTVERNLVHALAEFRSEMDHNLAELEHGLTELRRDMEHGLTELRGDLDRTRTELRAELNREVAEVVRTIDVAQDRSHCEARRPEREVRSPRALPVPHPCGDRCARPVQRGSAALHGYRRCRRQVR